MIYKNLLDLVGNTPVYQFGTIQGNEVYVKLEMMNPALSIKDRVAKQMIADLEEKGFLNSTSKLVEATSGNTGIGLAFVCAVKGFSLTVVMPENMSVERISLMKAYGAKVILTPKEKGMQGAEELASEMGKKGYLFLNQFENKSNTRAHEKTTALEILSDFPDGLDYFVAGVGTAGTLIGNAHVLKKHYPSIKIVALEPEESEVLEGKKAASHQIQGIGANFLPPLYEKKMVDFILPISSSEAVQMAHDLAKKGLFVGISSGANIAGAIKIAEKNPGQGLKILTVAPDGGIKYMSMGIYGE